MRCLTRILLKPAYDVTIAERAIDVEMKVWNFTLPETRDWPLQTFFWGPNYFDNDEAQALKLMHSPQKNVWSGQSRVSGSAKFHTFISTSIARSAMLTS